MHCLNDRAMFALHCPFGASVPKKGAVSNLMTLVLILMAGLMGASGVILAAAAAHAKSGMGLDGAGYLLLFHAVAVLSGVALLQQSVLLRPLVISVLSGWVLGSTLFAGDIAVRFRRLPPISHGSANRGSRTHSGMARSRCGCHFDVVAQLVTAITDSRFWGRRVVIGSSFGPSTRGRGVGRPPSANVVEMWIERYAQGAGGQVKS
jgi:uncharacterized membrane protein YgdD (TMEM256/DUF423 family)